MKYFKDKVYYEDVELFWITTMLSNLIINVESINQKFGRLTDFSIKFDLSGNSNGKLFITDDMIEDYEKLVNLINNELTPLGFQPIVDYVFVPQKLGEEYNIYIVNMLNEEIPELKDLTWLESLITPDGEYVWHKKTKTMKNYYEKLFEI